jgi:hypothetical protein
MGNLYKRVNKICIRILIAVKENITICTRILAPKLAPTANSGASGYF